MALTPVVRIGNLVAAITANTTDPQYILRNLVPRRSMGAKRRLRALVDGVITTGVAVLLNITITVQFGTQTLTVVSNFALALGLNSRPYKIIVTITSDDAMSSQSVTVDFYETVTNASVFSIRTFQGTFSQPIATADTEFAVKVAFSNSNTGTSMTRHMSFVELAG